MPDFAILTAVFSRLQKVAAPALALLLSVGCQNRLSWPLKDRLFSESTKPQAETHAATAGKGNANSNSVKNPAGDPFKLLADENWILAVPAIDQPEEPRYRWRHRALEEILDRPKQRQFDWQGALKSEKQIVQVNAAIALARLGQCHPQETLVAAVGATDLKLPVRRAAAEALGELRTPESLAALRELVDQYGRFTGEARTRYVPELHAELLRSLARQAKTAGDPRIGEALKSPAPVVKREALEALRNSDVDREKAFESLPPLALDLATDADSLVRIAALRLLVARHHPQATDKVERALADSDISVRFTAIELLGHTGGEPAHAKLKTLASDHAELTRVAAIRALAALEDRESVEAAAAEPSWRVRRAVATSLKNWPDRRSTTLARQFLTDASMEVQRETIRTLVAWPAAQAGPLLLAAMESPNYLTRKEAATQLADRWPAAVGFPIDAPTSRRAELLNDLQAKWTAEFGNVDRNAIASAGRSTESTDSPLRDQQVLQWLEEIARNGKSATAAIESLAALGTALPPILDRIVAEHEVRLPQLVYQEVLPRCDHDFELVNQLADGDANIRRSAMAALATKSSEKTFSTVAVARIASLLTTQTDSVVWLHAFKLIEHDPREAAAELAAAGLSHPAAEVRRRACGYFAAYPDAKRSEMLVAALSDQNISVLRAAVQALGEGPALADPASVEKLLAESDHALRLDAATALAHWKLDSGRAALERLAADGDPKIRRATAQAIGALGNADLLPTLIKLLDDQQDVRRAALLSLRDITGSASPPRDYGVQPAAAQSAAEHTDELAIPLADQAQRWKQWFRANYQR